MSFLLATPPVLTTHSFIPTENRLHTFENRLTGSQIQPDRTAVLESRVELFHIRSNIWEERCIVEIPTVLHYCVIFTHFHGKANFGPARRWNKDQLVFQPIKGKHGVHPTMLSSSYLWSILDPQTVSSDGLLLAFPDFKKDTLALATVNGEFKVCCSAAFHLFQMNQIFIPLWKIPECRMFWGDLAPIKLWHKYDGSDFALVQHLKGKRSQIHRLNAPSYWAALRFLRSAGHSWFLEWFQLGLLLCDWRCLSLTPESHTWFSSARPGPGIKAASARVCRWSSNIPGSAFNGSWAATTAGNLRPAAVNKAAEGCV